MDKNQYKILALQLKNWRSYPIMKSEPDTQTYNTHPLLEELRRGQQKHSRGAAYIKLLSILY